MRATLHSLICSIATLCGAVGAQTFVVDASGGPGANFTSITAAVAAVPDGSRLVVRPGNYQSFEIDGIGLWILADPGTTVSGTTTIRNTQSQQTVVLRGIEFDAITPGESKLLWVTDCAGPVVLSTISMPDSMPAIPIGASYWASPSGLLVQQCSQLVVRACELTSTKLIFCNSVIESCILRGQAGTPTGGIPAPAHEGLLVSNGTADIFGGTEIVGGDGLPSLGDYMGLQISSATVRMRSGLISPGNGVGATPSWTVVALSGTLRVDPAVAIITTGLPAVLGGALYVDLPEVTSFDAPPGGTMQAAAWATPGDIVALFAGELGPRMLVAGLPDPFWFDPAVVGLMTLGVQTTTGPVLASLDVPNTPNLRGAELMWQAVVAGPDGLRMSNPSLALVQ